MKKAILLPFAVVVASAALVAAKPAPIIAPEPAPAFSLPASGGGTVNLADFKGKYVVLEWWNHGCPVVQRHYRANNIQTLQKQMNDKGVIWLSICSSAPGAQGHVTGEEGAKVMMESKGSPHAVLLDPTGEVGKKYGAKTTPHMFLISPEGTTLYNGAIDNNSRGNLPSREVVNYLVKAYEEASSGKDVSEPKTRPYGCSVKYAN